MFPRKDGYESIARVAQVFASPERLRIVDLLAQRRRSVEELAEASHISVKLASHHLQVLRREEVVTVRRQGRHSIYSLAGHRVVAFWLNLRGFAETQSARLSLERSRLVERRRKTGMLDREAALEAIRDGTAFVMDVRPRSEFKAAHLPEAVSVPLEELHSRLGEIPEDRLVIAYCRGPYCELADEAIEILSERGIEAVRLEDGPPDWAQVGFPLDGEAAERGLPDGGDE